MSIVDAIKKLREQLTGEPGKGASITDAINDLTEGLTGAPGVGASIADAISNFAEHADDISGGGGSSETVLYEGSFTTAEMSPGLYGATFSMYESVPYGNLPTNIKAVYNGETYSLPKVGDIEAVYGEVSGGGMPVFTTFPIAIALAGDGDYATNMMVTTQTAETNTIKASAKISSGGDASPFSTCLVKFTKAAGVSGDSFFAVPSVDENPDSPVYGITSQPFSTGSSWNNVSLYCPMYDGYLNIFMSGGNDVFSVTSGIAQVSQDGTELFIEGDCEIQVNHK